MRKILRGIVFVCVIFFHTLALAEVSFDYPEKVSQGRLFPVKMQAEAPFQGLIYWLDKEVPFFSVPAPKNARSKTQKHEATVHLGVPVPAEGKLSADIRMSVFEPKLILAQTHFFTIEIEPVAWYTHNLSVEPKFVNPPDEFLIQIDQNRLDQKKMFQTLRTNNTMEFPLQRPVKGTISGSFAARRVFNDEHRPPHLGTDMRGAIGTPILAVADGEVVLADNHYYAGNVIYVDHGQGIISMYAHLSAFKVKTGDRVKKGQHIGDVGATGRVTGPHLHMSLYAQGIAVDIMPLFELPYSTVGGPTKEQSRPK